MFDFCTLFCLLDLLRIARCEYLFFWEDMGVNCRFMWRPGNLSSSFGRHCSSVPSVIVIGGGISGIAAARVLHNASYKVFVCYTIVLNLVNLRRSCCVVIDLSFCLVQVLLLESRDRLGGRIHTDYSFGCPVDMGASW